MTPTLIAVGSPSLAVDFDLATLQRLSTNGPRYTSYPTADRFASDFTEKDYILATRERRERGLRAPLSLYIHIPFCESVCYYCACNKVVTKDRRKANHYLNYLEQEIALHARHYDGQDIVSQLHWGGGTPTYLEPAQLHRLMQSLRESFQFASDELGEYSIEIDPRTVNASTLSALRSMGFNRVSLGVQDIDPKVQQAINRIQPIAQTLDVMGMVQRLGFRSTSIDLIYGLPHQSVSSFRQTIDTIIAARPSRIALYHYAHLPSRFKPQRRIDELALPSSAEKLLILQLAIEQLAAAGYAYIGMDHFALPTDELAIAQRQGRLHRNFQGYSTHAQADLIGIGVSAIGAMGRSYLQNARDLETYYALLDNKQLPIQRGLHMTMDDRIRRTVIQSLMCHFELCKSAVEEIYPIDFDAYFQSELIALKPFIADGLIQHEGDWLSVTPKGRLVVRNVAMVFDAYLRQGQPTLAQYSQTV
ncbi:oxygen-independent coproporphyrinogen III oxidase [Parvibium lacunae]|uniref:Coproporphyrinogen-III oxidase n=2 Tax=Parvibium lacunae TaxID=1888893 RepID=A0A368L8V2_9BURK|nr:oxygen-independent coproporphyrinogen III oxidase [Parvibium lacunae]